MVDIDVVEHSDLLRQEADRILYAEGLLLLLKTYGPTRVIGSYTLNTMTWPDIDISMVLPYKQDVELFFDIGQKIALNFQVTRMSFSNHYIRGLPGFDHGLYWGIRVNFAEREWKIDLWGYCETDYNAHMADFDSLHKQLMDVDRSTILCIKLPISQRPDYRGKTYNSMAVYQAVLSGKVTTVAEFYRWIERITDVNI